jgi:hypothetical protein
MDFGSKCTNKYIHMTGSSKVLKGVKKWETINRKGKVRLGQGRGVKGRGIRQLRK